MEVVVSYKEQKLKELYENTIESGILYNESLDYINYYSLMCKATSKDFVINLNNCNVYSFKYNYDNSESVLFLFSIPLVCERNSKHISERIMDVVQLLEKTFITLNYLSSNEIKEDKFVYLVAIKKIK